MQTWQTADNQLLSEIFICKSHCPLPKSFIEGCVKHFSYLGCQEELSLTKISSLK